MQKTKRKGRGKNMARLNKKPNASKTVLTQRPIHPDEDECSNLVKFSESSSSELTKQIESKLSECVVSLASFVGDMVVSECAGIFIENSCADVTSVLTSASIAGSSDHGITDNLKIKVCLPSNRVVIGWLDHCDFKYDIAVVKIRRVRGFQEANLSSSHRMQFESNSKLVAVGRCFDTGMLQSIEGIVCATMEPYEFMLPTYSIITAWIGCPLIDFAGNLVGLNVRYGERTAFVPVHKILECLRNPGTIRHGAADTNDNRGSVRHSAADTNDNRGLNSWSRFHLEREQMSRDVTFARKEDLYGGVIWC